MKNLLFVLMVLFSFQSMALSKKDFKKCSKVLKKWKKSKEKKLTDKLNKLKCLEDESLKFEYKRVLAGYDSKFKYKKNKVKKKLKKWLAYIADKYDTFAYFYESHDNSRRKFVEKKFGDCSVRIYPTSRAGEANVQIKSEMDMFKQDYNGDISKIVKPKDIKQLYTSSKLLKKFTHYVYDKCLMRK